MKRPNTYLLASVGLAIALMTGSAEAGHKGSMKFKGSTRGSSQMRVNRPTKSFSKSNLVRRSGNVQKTSRFSTSPKLRTMNANVMRRSTKSTRTNPSFVSKFNGTKGKFPAMNSGKGNNGPFKPIDPGIGNGKPYKPVGPIKGSAPWNASPIANPGKPFTPVGPIKGSTPWNPSPIANPGKPFTPVGPIKGTPWNPSPIANPGKPFTPVGPIKGDRPWNPGPIADPGKPFTPVGPIKGDGPWNPGPIADPGKPWNPSPIDPPTKPADPPTDPPADPPADPCPPKHPGYCGGWGYPIPFPFPGGGYGGGYCGPTTVVQPVYETIEEPLATGTLDLELLEVQQLDRGDLAKNLGPAYRLTLRNKSGLAVKLPFNVALAASTGRQATPDSAFATQRVEGLEAGQVLTIDLRLPAKAYQLGLNADGQPVPFAFLTAVVDSHQELPESDRDNDYMVLARGEIVMLALR